MGQDLLTGILEMPAGKKPNFKAAWKLWNSFSPKKSCEIINDAEQHGYENPEEELNPVDCLSKMKEAYNAVKEGWEGDHRLFVKHTLTNGDKLLITAGLSWGDSIETCDQVALFYESGMAKAAGFNIYK